MAFATGLGVGIVGGGFMAEVHSRASRAAGAQLIGIASSSPARSDSAAERLGIERGFASLDDLVDDPRIGVVHVCTPNALHAEQAERVVAAGKHVVCEKPLATTVADARRLTDAADAAAVVASVPFVYRFHPLVREARARVAAGETGRLLTINASYLQDWLLQSSDDNWRVDEAAGGRSRAFADIGSHLVDLVEFVTGDRVVRVAAAKRTFFADRAEHSAVTTEDAVAATVETASGAIGTFLVSQVAPGRKNRLLVEISGDAESIVFDQEQPETIWLGRRSGSVVLPRDAEQLAPDAARLVAVPAGHAQGYQDAFNAFVADTYAAIRGEDPGGLPVFADGLRAGLVTEAVMGAADSGAWVDVA
ncbi:Gfo/Idh/MocA family protein [Labedella endophytica]|uniref:Gfo/Idh/MocA family oxidoreductase n=1 Tax=Labedella endophytica TaxID=1523160 RepID=A0A3S0VBE6_9MICO|nr:Gfo/Idh/MocA family oxidoreductase [Labedella endophytica]RUR01477.1 Gfo/Idh/MocA family oxidoreductase [Labedella endophytica]